MPLRFWRRAWKKHSWLRRLSGLTSPPSTLEDGAASWMSSLRATRASRSALQAAAEARTTLDTCGRMLPAWSANPDQLSFFSRTSPAIYDSASMRSARIFTAWAIALRADYSARRNATRLTGGSDSSHCPTTTAEDSEQSQARRLKDRTLTTEIRAWPTPDAGVSQQDNRSMIEGAAVRPNLAKLAKDWPTPCTQDSDHGDDSEAKREGSMSLRGASSVWQTPAADSLDRQARWVTPAARDWKGANGPDHLERNVGRMHMDQLANQVEYLFGPQAPQENGAGSPATSGPPSQRLNPRFVEWLMGLPPRWISFAPVGTEWFRSWRARHSSALLGS